MLKIKSELSVFLFCSFIVFAVYMLTRPMVTLDSFWVIPSSLSILNDGDMNLDEFMSYNPVESYSAVKINDHYFNYFPYGISILILPLVFFLKFFFSDAFLIEHHAQMEKLIASLLIVASLYFLYKLFLFYLSKWKSGFLIMAVALCTPLFTSGSRALWQHPGSVLMLSISLYILVYSLKRNSDFLPLLGIALTSAYIIRPTNSIPLLVISLFVLFQFRNNRVKYCIAILASGLIFLGFNYLNFGELLPPYYSSSRLAFEWESFKVAILANLFSPNRGLLIWSPFLIFAFFSFGNLKSHNLLAYISMLIIVLHIFAVSLFPHWWAGHSVGPRFMTDIIPFFALLLCLSMNRYYQYNLFKFSFLVFVLISFSIQLSAAISKKTQLWNIRDSDINLAPERIWDWYKPQFYPFD
ncbi:hypothetical protein EHQ68_02070 [Leptospira congkakensis]|uniref:Dolichyl-phosphate-mannose--protein mannosyltransferase n=1 Tax=Leptospira congkakensis TaxID=2484932 RepID=A0A4Z1A6F4_9LEPT|nr:hypothetical protein [Leptospira congkakensis]TGL90243.1 hypothetical protein EHQ69_09835 [Leptospira congkakensis]TGL91249.1 hypothetical protein EHQ68_02070 [Leptospira congkakensis]TGL98302.1 hypothetical protein EHQ70_01660 [Leptospira congkakensis]